VAADCRRVPFRCLSTCGALDSRRADHIVYIATIDDAKVYARPWKLRVDFRRQKVEEQWESAIWEGNKTPEIVLSSPDTNK
jgi:hypothetical protein